MSSFLLTHRANLPRNQHDAGRQRFEERGMACTADLALGEHRLALFSPMKSAQPAPVLRQTTPEGEDLFTITGTWFYRWQHGAEALEACYRAFLRDPAEALLALSGHYTVIARINGELQLCVDPTGTAKVYCHSNGALFSDSFLVALETLPSRTLRTQEMYEYVFRGAMYGGRTFLEELHILRARRLYTLQNGTAPKETALAGMLEEPGTPEPQAELFDQVFERLSAWGGAIAERYGDDAAAPLTGGHDSRLLLATLRRAGVSPELFVSGPEKSPDVRIAKRIAEGEGIPLHHLTPMERLSPESFHEAVRQNYLMMDGAGAVFGIFEPGAQLRDKQTNSRRNSLLLNGGGGEVLRNFFNLPDREHSLASFVLGYFDRVDPRAVTGAFDRSGYLASLAAKTATELGLRGKRLSRQQVELIYATMQLQYWIAQNVTLNNHFADALSPLMDGSIVLPASRVSIGEKMHGRFVGRLIHALDPPLARYPSEYGHPLDGSAVSAKARMKDLFAHYAPNRVRPFLRIMRARKRGGQRPYYMAKEYLAPFFPGGEPPLGEYLRWEAITDAQTLSRAATVAYLLTGGGGS